MASLEELILSGLKGESEYMQANPWVTSGMQIAGTAIQPKNNLQAILIPALQGAIGGGLYGYGKRQAADEMYRDYSRALGVPVEPGARRPEGWKAEDIQMALLQSAGQRQAEQLEDEQKRKRQADLTKELIGKYGSMPEFDDSGALVGTRPLPGLENYDINKKIAEREALLPLLEQETKIKGKYDPSGTSINMPATDATAARELGERVGIIANIKNLAKKIKEDKPGVAEMVGGKYVSYLDKRGYMQAITANTERFLRSLTGAAAPQQDRETAEAILAGDLSILGNPERLSSAMERFAELESQQIVKEDKATRSLRAGASMEEVIAEAIGGGTASAPIIFNGQRGRLVKKN